MTNTLSLPRTTNPIAEFLKDFDREFFHFNNMIDWTSDIPTLRNTMIDHPKLGEKMISVKLNERCGVILKDGKYHFNLWDYSNPNLISAIGIDWEEVVFNG